jgi:argininosuccinate lyase
MLVRIEIDGERAAAAAAANFALATDLADYLVRKGMPFREAHEVVGKLVRHAESRKLQLHEVPLADMRVLSDLFDEDARRIDARASVASRDVPGGTAPRRVKRALSAAAKRVDTMLDGAEGTLMGSAPAGDTSP